MAKRDQRMRPAGVSKLFVLIVLAAWVSLGARCASDEAISGANEGSLVSVAEAVQHAREQAERAFSDDASADKSSKGVDRAEQSAVEPVVYEPGAGLPLSTVLLRGGTVHLPAGEHIIPPLDIDRPIQLTADAGAVLTIRSSDHRSDPFGLRLRADGSRVEGVPIVRTGGRSGVTIEADGCVVRGCTITGERAAEEGLAPPYGIRVMQGAQRTRLEGNTIRNAGVGILASRFTRGLIIAGNTIEDIQGQHGMYIGQGEDLFVIANTVRRCHYIGIKVQIDHLANRDARNVQIVGNVVEEVGNNGIAAFRTTVATHGRVVELKIIANRVQDCGGNGLRIRYARDVTVRGNTVSKTTRSERFEFVEGEIDR